MEAQRRDRIKSLTIGLVALLAMAGGIWGFLRAEPERELDRYYFRSSSGDVLFTHTAHQDLCDDCEDCHHELTQGADEATSCRNCHPVEASDEPTFLGCLDCHDDPDYTPDMAEHEDLVDLEDHDCEGCHSARSVSEAYHKNCGDCHQIKAPGRFAGEDGESLCSACHLVESSWR